MNPSAWERAAAYTDFGLFVVLVAAAHGAAFGWRLGAFVMIGALSASVLLHLAAGFLRYRATMRRPWPSVRPLDEEEEW